MTDKDYEKERRRQARLERLGSNTPCCIICVEKDPRVLHRHEPGGRKYNKLWVFVCLNHHAKVEELRKEHPRELTGTASYQECKGRLLLGIADLLSLMHQVSPELIELVRVAALDLVDRGQRIDGDRP